MFVDRYLFDLRNGCLLLKDWLIDFIINETIIYIIITEC